MRTRLTYALALLAASSIASADVFVVDSSGQGDFTDIQAAVDAANSNDALIVRPGTYSGFQVQGEGLKILGSNQGATIEGTVQISSSAGTVVILSNLRILNGFQGALIVGGDGDVRIQSCTLVGNSYSAVPKPGLRASSAASVLCTNTVITGRDGPYEGSGGLACWVSNSSVAFHSCTIEGGDGYDQGTSFPVQSGHGGSGMRVELSAFVYVTDSVIRGGDGGDYDAWDLPGFGGDGGHGVEIYGSAVHMQGGSPIGGAAGQSSNGFPGSNGSGILGIGYVPVAGQPRTVSFDRHWSAGIEQRAVFRGQSGDSVYMVRGNTRDFDYQVGLGGVWTIDSPNPPGDFIGTIGASGALVAELDSGALSGTQTVKTVFQQAYFVSSGGNAYLGTPDGTVLLALCDANTFCDAAPNSTGSGAQIGYAGGGSLSANDLVLTVNQAIPGQAGIFYYGGDPVQIPFGDGMRCVGDGLFRLPVVFANGNGSVNFPVDNQLAPMNAGAGALDPGTTWYFQFWYRDPVAGGSGFSLSDGLRMSFCH